MPRSKKPSKDRKDSLVAFRLEEDDLRKVDALAAASGIDRSKFFREGIQAFLDFFRLWGGSGSTDMDSENPEEKGDTR